MTRDDLQKIFDKTGAQTNVFRGACHECGAEATITVKMVDEDGRVEVSGGALYKPFNDWTLFCKCEKCYAADSNLHNYAPTEVYSRIVGYLRPIEQWNPGKRAEFYSRKDFNDPEE